MGRFQFKNTLKRRLRVGQTAAVGALVLLVAAVPVSAGSLAGHKNGLIIVVGPVCPQQICTMDATGKGLKVLTSAAALTAASNDCVNDCTPQEGVFSRDGSRIAFVVIAPTFQQLWVMNVDGTHMKPLTPESKLFPLEDPTWDPAGKTIAFAAVDKASFKKAVQIWAIHPNGTGLHALTDPATTPFAVGPAWSPDGTRIAFVAPDGLNLTGHAPPAAIFVMNADGANVHRLTMPGTDGKQSVAWGANSKWLAFSDVQPNWPTTNISTIYRVNADGTGQRQLTSSKLWDSGPVPSPDGTRILFTRQHGTATNTRPHLYEMNSDGTGLHLLLSVQAGASSWAPARP